MKLLKITLFWVLTMTCAIGFAQIGIGTTTPDASSILDIQSSTQGLLPPRMTTSQRTAIASPANGLVVFDTTLGSLYHYDLLTTSWIKISGEKEGRIKYKLIKSTDVLATVLAAEKTAGSNTKYMMDVNTLYEINGTINVDLPIELNNCYIIGQDAGEDKLIRATGDLFTGSTGGSIKILTLTATTGNVFNVMGTGSIGAGTQTQSFIVRDCIINASANVGKLENFALVFASIVQYIGNTTGIIYKDINKLLLSNAAWFGNNSGTYETLQGTFGLVQKQGGFSEVIGTKIGFDVSSNPVINGDAVLDGVVFTGTVTTGKYVNGYNPAVYTGFNFNNNWYVNSPGIPTEGDAQSTGTVYLNQSGTAQAATPLGTQGVNTKLNITAGLTANLFRTTATTNNRITYVGKKGRIFQVNCAVAFDYVSGTGNTEYAFFVMRIPAAGGTDPQVPSETIIDTNAGYIQAFPIQGAVYLNSGDSIEIWIRRVNANSQTFKVRTFSMTMK
ncbi:hypothetical protein [Flavobacterium pallidum]|uniref:Cell wall anchor protein n=1 Tax=Flavobacterium pallidum TaxID=2172098 RepID=A0A2S1SGW9_9FLAO|nr:hypothetical protein [Flavobacterium pallidum]AWI25625.1 hypothetical protein HYN49_06790 [Flavobacterium pallidum]